MVCMGTSPPHPRYGKSCSVTSGSLQSSHRSGDNFCHRTLLVLPLRARGNMFAIGARELEAPTIGTLHSNPEDC